MKNEKNTELTNLVESFEVEELEQRLEFASCHWGDDGHEGDGNIVNCHFD